MLLAFEAFRGPIGSYSATSDVHPSGQASIGRLSHSVPLRQLCTCTVLRKTGVHRPFKGVSVMYSPGLILWAYTMVTYMIHEHMDRRKVFAIPSASNL